MAFTPYVIPAAPVVWEQEIKKSRFIACLAHTPNAEAAKAFIERLRAEYPDARHHCSAFIAGAPNDSQALGFGDDGEPSGTAGRPMLAVLQGAGIGEITAVVVRYFGGIKLGTGGLVRAYGSSVNGALAELTTMEKVIEGRLALSADYSDMAQLESLLAQNGAGWEKVDYGAVVSGVLRVDMRLRDTLVRQIKDRTQGRVIARPITD
ncbi:MULTISPECIES: YigZ family protein [Oceanimonas]|uniref:YigZ family protein n=1 Tax=Oceanimonas doudoroffii TaxID=84158 RepID=A0A233RAT7_9GAMM|nr:MULTISPECIES: YigZ family protein [Oceanimonas]NHI02155.1 IMPACT family member YigZ [Oceanimonas sp. MB9]OXY80519.1 YigZ family protein [Oceanimonas doudoroffii]